MGLLSSIFGGIIGKQTASKNVRAANKYADKTKWDPTNITMPGAQLTFDANGNPTGTAEGSPNQGIANSLYGAGSNLLGMAGPQSTQLPPWLMGAYGQSNQDINGISQGFQGANNFMAGLMGQLPGQYNTQLGGQFQGQASQALGQLGSFDPNQLAASYTQNLRNQALPGERNAAQTLGQDLFNTGRLGSTGGQDMFGRLSEAQSQADLGRVIAGQQLGQQQQQGLAGMAGMLGQTGEGINLNALGMNNQTLGTGGALAGQFGNLLGQTNQTTNQRFMNAMNLFGGVGQQQSLDQNQQNLNMQGALGSLGLGSNFGNQDTQNLMQMLGLSGQLSSAQGQNNLAAYMPALKGKIASNNASGAGWMSGISQIGKVFGI